MNIPPRYQLIIVSSVVKIILGDLFNLAPPTTGHQHTVFTQHDLGYKLTSQFNLYAKYPAYHCAEGL